ncbi:MAG: GNAT family N-acetyltransferase [Methanomassiliicoccales archaeon]|jgi:ribosomal protein S18 acetylase RimI-like enzyme|nr:GNAT family N-acetyltransferase [Methanomassiliicoccales archaeon]
MRVARAEEGDLPQVVERWREMMILHERMDPVFEMAPDGEAVFEGFLRTCLASEEHLLLVAKEGKEVLGYLLAHIESRQPVFRERTFGEISDLAVREDHWREGVGERMLKGSMKWFKSKGVERIEVRASPSNAAAIGFWRKHGFEEYSKVMRSGSPP